MESWIEKGRVMLREILISSVLGLVALPLLGNTYVIDPDNTYKAVKVLESDPIPAPRDAVLMRDPIVGEGEENWTVEKEELSEPAKRQVTKVRVARHRLEFAEHSVIAKTIKPRVEFNRKSLPVEPDLGYHEVKIPPKSRPNQEL
jgi:hypothetical protein